MNQAKKVHLVDPFIDKALENVMRTLLPNHAAAGYGFWADTIEEAKAKGFVTELDEGRLNEVLGTWRRAYERYNGRT